MQPIYRNIPVLIVIFFLFLSPIAGAEDVGFYAALEVKKGWNAFKGGDIDEALRSFNQAAIIDSTHAPAYYGKGHVYLAKDKIGLAIKFFEKTIELAEPPMPEAYVNLGFSLTLIGREQDGLKMYNKALSIDPMNKDAHINLANFYCSELNGKKAWEHIRFAQKLGSMISNEQLAEMKSLCPENR
jgi:tetratricopeptide (TPR) repeat protein